MLDSDVIYSGLTKCLKDPNLVKKCIEVCVEEASQLKRQSHRGNMFSADVFSTLITLGIGVGIGATAVYLYDRYKQNAGISGAVAERDSCESNPIDSQIEEIRNWLETILSEFKLKSKGDYLESLRIQNRLSNDDVAELQLKYGKVLTTPTLIIQRTFSQRFSDNRLLWKAEQEWLEKHGVTGLSDTQCQDEIEKILLQEAKKEMQQEFDALIKK